MWEKCRREKIFTQALAKVGKKNNSSQFGDKVKKMSKLVDTKLVFAPFAQNQEGEKWKSLFRQDLLNAACCSMKAKREEKKKKEEEKNWLPEKEASAGKRNKQLQQQQQKL